MTEDSTHLSRRAAFATAGLAAVAAAFPAAAAEATPEEKASTKVVLDFMKAWAAPKLDAMELASHVAEQCFVTVSPGPPIPLITRAAVADAFKPFIPAAGTTYEFAILETAALGPSVYTKRMDYTIKDGKRDAGTPAVGIFVVKDGKIKNWHDYAFPRT